MMRFPRFLLTLGVVLAVAIIAARLIFALPDISDRAESMAIPASTDTEPGQLIDRAGAERAGLSGVIPLQDCNDALASRLMLADSAEATIDLQ